MSHYDWERGEFVLSTAEFRRVRNELAAAVNKMSAEDLKTAEEIYAALLQKKKTAPRGTSWHTLFNEVAFEEVKIRRYGYDSTQPRYEFNNLSAWRLERILFERETKNEAGQVVRTTDGPPMKPKKKDFPVVPATKFDGVVLEDTEATITLNPKNRTLVWNVSQNNHAVDRARGHKLGGLLFSILSKVNWTRGTGGVITGNDEYNRDNKSLGGGRNLLKESFGPRGEQAREDEYASLGLRRPSRSVTKSRASVSRPSFK